MNEASSGITLYRERTTTGSSDPPPPPFLLAGNCPHTTIHGVVLALLRVARFLRHAARPVK